MRNKLLIRQAQKHFGSLENIPEAFVPFLKIASESYDRYEKDYRMLEHSVDLSSNEMIELYDKLRYEADELKKMQGEINRILNNVNEVIFSLNITTYQYVYISSACETVYGYTVQDFHTNPFLWKDAIHPEDIHLANEQDERLYKGERFETEYRIVHRNGDIKWVNADVIPTLDNEGNWVRLDVIINDITNIKQAQLKLEETNNQLNHLFNTINDCMFVVDMAAYKLLHISAACAKIYGYNPAEFYADGDLWSNVIHPDDQHVLQEQYRLIYNGEQVFNQYRIIHKDGSIRWIENNVIPTMDEGNKVTRLDGITRDITEQKIAADALRDSEQRYRLISENPTLGITWSSLKDGMLYVNDAFCDMLGYSQKELKGMHYSLFTHPEDNFRDEPFVMKVFEGELNNFRSEKRYITKSRKIIWGSLNLSSVRNEDGSVKYCIAVVQDITSRKKAEAKLKTLNKLLERKVIERTARLEEANKDLEAFNYMISHDLRTPLKGIEMFNSILQKRIEETGDESMLRYLDNIHTCTEEMNNLIKHLLEFSKVGRALGEQDLRRDRIRMKDLVWEVFAGLSSIDAKSKVELVMDDIPDVYADSVLLKQVVVNLLSNAIKYSSKKEVVSIKVEGKVNGRYIDYSITDNGAGFDMKDADKLFKPFSRLHNAEDFKGNGAGLAIVKKIVNFHNGNITARSILGEGATFCFSLPLNNEL